MKETDVGINKYQEIQKVFKDTSHLFFTSFDMLV